MPASHGLWAVGSRDLLTSVQWMQRAATSIHRIDAANIDAADAGVDAAGDSAIEIDGSSPLCIPNQPLRCEGSNLVSCNGDGTGEISEACVLGCRAVELRCTDVDPSNGLAQYLDMTAGEPDLDLGATATLNADDGTVLVNGSPVAVKSATRTQAPAPTIRIFIVHSLKAADVKVTGSNAVAIVSHGDLKIDGVFAASASGGTPGAGGYDDGGCTGVTGVNKSSDMLFSGGGGGGFAFPGGRGGSATNSNGSAAGSSGGVATGNVTLVPLRGGCRSGSIPGGSFGAGGGGAIQLVSRTKIAVGGVIAANGASLGGGGSGGGILLEAPAIEMSGAVVANGGGGTSGCFFSSQGVGEDGRLDATPASGGASCNVSSGAGGNGGARSSGARNGADVDQSGTASLAAGGSGGGSVGRIRVNTVSGGLPSTGVFSPNPTTGSIATR